MLNKNFYRAFEDKYRGSREIIKERVSVYLPFVLSLKDLYPNVSSLDIGCGRGEWLELLKDNGMSAKGIDFDEGMLNACHALDLNVLQGNGISYLKEQKDESLLIVSAFHVVEHITFEELQELISESLRVLKPGGILIMETPNPENVKVATENFYLDPTHNRPIPSNLLSFLPEFYGYNRTKIMRVQESKLLVDKIKISINDIIEGVSPDYAVIAQKGAPLNILKKFDHVFNQEFGISLNSLTHDFENRLTTLEEKASEAEKKASEAEKKASEAEKKATHFEMMVLNSLSWKITKPLRFIKGLPRKILRRLNEKILKRIYDVNKEKIDANIIKPENKRKKLLVDCSFIYTSGLNTGIQRVVRNIVNNIEPYAIENNLDLVTVALVDGFIVKVDINSKKFTTNSRLLGLLYRIKQKVQLYWSLQKDIETVYSEDILLMLDSTWHLNIWPSVEYAKKRHVKIIGVTYDLIPISHPQFCDESLVKLFTNWYEKSIDYFDGYIAISKTVMLDLKSYLEKKDININKYSFDYFKLGSDFSDMKYNDINIDEKIRKIYLNNKSIYLTVSTIEPRKNHRYLFETFKKLWTTGIDVTLVIVGKEGWKTKDLLLEMRSHLEYGKKLLIFNHLNDNELQYCYKNSKALLFPSFIEGYGLPIIESLQNGLNVLASDTPIHREVGGENIDYFDINDSNSLHTIIEKIENKKLILKSLNDIDIIIPKWKDSAKELCLIANSTSNYKAFNTSSYEKELLVDITHIYTDDLKTGIQRVVRSILNELKVQISLKVRTIFLTNEDGFFCYKYVDTQKIVVPKKEDIFLGLDLNSGIIKADNAGLFTDWKSRGTSITFVVYDILPILNSHWWPKGVNNGHESWLNVLLKYSDKIFCISQSVKNDVELYIDNNNVKLNENLIVSWFHLGADIANSNPSLGMPIESENVLSIIESKFSFLMVGTIEPRKGHLQTLEAFELLWKDDIDVNLIIVGKEGWMVEKLINKIKDHPYLGLNLFWLDGISDEYLDKVYNRSTCLLASSEGEGFGLPLIEAAQCKKPIIARDILVFKEVASTFAYYFKDDNNPEIIAKTINEWLELYEKDNHPKSDDMNWLTWKESSKELQNLIIGIKK